MAGKKRKKEREHTAIQSSLICAGLIAVIYIAFALILTFMVSSEKLNIKYGYPAALAALWISSFAAVKISMGGKKEKRIVVASAAAGIMTCALVILPLAVNRGVELDHVWKSMACVWAGCLPAVVITGRIKRKRKRR